MEIQELIKRIREKESPKRAEQLIGFIKERGIDYAKIYLMELYDDIHMKYDRVFDDEIDRGVLIVEKDGMYGVVNNNGDIIIPCEFNGYWDAYHEWEEMGFPKEMSAITEEQMVVQQFKNGLKIKHNELINSGDIKPFKFFNERTINGAEFVKLSDGSIGIAASVIIADSERGKNIEIKNANGEHVMFLSEPELFKGSGTPWAVICSDENNLYVATYNTDYSYIASYRMGDFKNVWKTSIYGSRIQSITVNDDEVIVFDLEDGKIKYFDKQNGKRNEDKKISTSSYGVKVHHNLAATNERLLVGTPGLSLGLLSFESELKVFDNATGESIAQKSVGNFLGTLNSLTVDQQNNRIFMAFDNKIAVFAENGYLGYFLAPTRNIHKLNFDQETGCLMISMTEKKGKVEIYNPEAITTLLQTSRVLKTKLETKKLKTTPELVESSQVVQEQFNDSQEQNKHVR